MLTNNSRVFNQLFLLSLSLQLINTQLLSRHSCPVSDTYCGSCSEHNTCDFCNGSFSNQYGICNVPQTKVEHCISYFNDGYCKTCQLGYTAVDGKCQQIQVKDCAKVDDKGKCFMCANNIKVHKGNCFPYLKCQIPNCDYCIDKDGLPQCSKCSTNYVLTQVEQSNGIDLVCRRQNEDSQNCLLLALEGTCQICDINYQNYKGKQLSAVMSTEKPLLSLTVMGFHEEDKIEPSALEVYIYRQVMKELLPEFDPNDLSKLEKLLFQYTVFQELEKKDYTKKEEIYQKKLITKYLGLPDYTDEDEELKESQKK